MQFYTYAHELNLMEASRANPLRNVCKTEVSANPITGSSNPNSPTP